MADASVSQTATGHGSPIPVPVRSTRPSDASDGRRPAIARLSINQMTTPRWSLEEDLERYFQAGIPAIGLNWQKFNDDATPRDVERIREGSLPVSSLGWCGWFTGAGGQTYRDAMLDARRKLRVARQVGADCLLVIPGPQATHIRTHAARLTVDALSELCEAASDSSVRIAIQPMHALFRKGWSFLNTLEETLRLLERVGCQQAGMCFGTYHLWQEENLITRIPEALSRIALVQLSDWRDSPRCENDRAMIGEGRVPLRTIIGALEASGYRGYYEVEVWSRDLWKQDHVDLIDCCLRRYLEFGDRIATATRSAP